MGTFDDRKKSFETQFTLDQETAFRVGARRNRLFGLWLAGRLGKTGDEAEDYARTVIAADLRRPGDDDVVEKVMADLKAHGISDLDESRIRVELARFAAEARRQITGSDGSGRGA
jgi:hypothetical protein